MFPANATPMIYQKIIPPITTWQPAAVRDVPRSNLTSAPFHLFSFSGGKIDFHPPDWPQEVSHSGAKIGSSFLVYEKVDFLVLHLPWTWRRMEWKRGIPHSTFARRADRLDAAFD